MHLCGVGEEDAEDGKMETNNLLQQLLWGKARGR